MLPSTCSRSKPTPGSSRSTACDSTSGRPFFRPRPSIATFDERVDAEARDPASARRRSRSSATFRRSRSPPPDRAGVPSVALGNFTWDWIYGSYPAFETQAPDVIPTIARAYATATRALRLPFHGGFEPMAAVTHDIPLIARRSRRDPGGYAPAAGDSRGPSLRARFVRRVRRSHCRTTPVRGHSESSRCSKRRATPTARPRVSGSRRGGRRRRQQARLRHRVGMHRERHGAALHVARPLHRVRRVRRRDAARPSLPVHFAGRSAGRPMGRGDFIAARATRSAGARARRWRGGRRRHHSFGLIQALLLGTVRHPPAPIAMLYSARCHPRRPPKTRRSRPAPHAPCPASRARPTFWRLYSSSSARLRWSRSGMEIQIGFFHLSMRSAWRPYLWALILLGIRNWFVPEPATLHWLSQTGARSASLRRTQPVRRIADLAAAHRQARAAACSAFPCSPPR